MSWLFPQQPRPEAKIEVVARQSPDWAGITSVDDLEPERFDTLVGRPAGTSRRLTRVGTRPCGYRSGLYARRLLRSRVRIGHRLSSVGLSRWTISVANWPIERTTLRTSFSLPTTMIGTRRTLQNELRAVECGEVHAVLWGSVKLSNNIEVRGDSNRFFFTNNYAVSSRCFRENIPLEKVAQHFDANQTFMSNAGSGYHVHFLNKSLSVTNKHPCSFTYLERITADGEFGSSLRRAVETYCDALERMLTDDSFVNWERMDWMRAPLKRQQDLFQKVL